MLYKKQIDYISKSCIFFFFLRIREKCIQICLLRLKSTPADQQNLLFPWHGKCYLLPRCSHWKYLQIVLFLALSFPEQEFERNSSPTGALLNSWYQSHSMGINHLKARQGQ